METQHFGDVFRTLAGLGSYTDAELCERTGWSRTTVNGKKLCKLPIRVKEVARIAEALRVPEESFFIEDVEGAVAEAIKYMRWDPDTGALRGVHETGQYSPTGRIRERALIPA
jgi:transcriptional regulator with XRE-family HTH domain